MPPLKQQDSKFTHTGSKFVEFLTYASFLMYPMGLSLVGKLNFVIPDLILLLGSVLALKNPRVKKLIILNKFLAISLCFLLIGIAFIHYLAEGFSIHFLRQSGQLLFTYISGSLFCCLIATTASDFCLRICFIGWYLFAIFNIILFHFLGVGLLLVEANNRIYSYILGTSVIIPCGYAALSVLIQRQKINVITKILIFIFAACITNTASFYSGQRSLFLGTVFITLFILFSWIKVNALLKLVYISLILILGLIFIDFENLNIQIVNNGLRSFSIQDNERLLITQMFFDYLSKDKIAILIGTTSFSWTDPYWAQEPHNFLLHLTSDFGIFVGFVLCALYFKPLLWYKKKKPVWVSTAFVGLLGVVPLFATHTYSFERVTVVFLLVFTLKAYSENYKCNQKLNQKDLF